MIDSSRDLAISTNATRAHFGLPSLEQKVINSYVGNGAAVLMQKATQPELGEDRLQEALDYFLKYYRAHSLEHTRPYNGVPELVEDLSAAGHRMAVLTNKPEKISFDILGALGLQQHFFRVVGGNTLPHKKPDPAGILKLSQEAAIALPETLMVGDSSVDVQTARNAGVRSCGVTWGFQPDSFREMPPDFTIDEPAGLLALVNSGK